MTVWLVIPAEKETAFRAFYAAEKVRGNRKTDRAEDETIGAMRVGKAGNLMTGTSRMSAGRRHALAGRKPAWLQIFTEFPPASAWEPPEPAR